MKLRLPLLAVAIATVSVGRGAAEDAGAELARGLQRKYDTVKDFAADFVQTYQGGVLKRQRAERGRLLVKKPGKWRWEYTSPEQKLFVSDGVTMWYYIPEDRQVVVGPVPEDAQANTPALFLAGKGSLVRDFTASLTALPPGMPEGSQALKLVPNTPQPDYESLTLVVEPRTLTLRGLLWLDAQGGTSAFTFSNLKENVFPADRQFVFTIPRGVDVVKGSSPR
jgi:outer membrane lipoprotein carrier protein